MSIGNMKGYFAGIDAEKQELFTEEMNSLNIYKNILTKSSIFLPFQELNIYFNSESHL